MTTHMKAPRYGGLPVTSMALCGEYSDDEELTSDPSETTCPSCKEAIEGLREYLEESRQRRDWYAEGYSSALAAVQLFCERENQR